MRDDASTSTNPNYGTVAPTTTEIITIKTTGTSLTVYKNGTSLGSLSFDVGATTLDTCSIGAFYRNGAPIAANYFQGYIGEVLVFNSALSDANRQAVEEYLTTKYLTAPIVQLDNLSTQTLMGPNDEDYFTVFTESAAFRYWWLEFVNEGTASIYACAKAMFGKALDFGREPTAPTQFNLARDAAHSREAAHSIDIKLEAINDTNKETFLTEIAKYSDVLPVVALDPSQLFLKDSKGFHAYLTDHSIEIPNLAENNISMTLKEQI